MRYFISATENKIISPTTKMRVKQQSSITFFNYIVIIFFLTLLRSRIVKSLSLPPHSVGMATSPAGVVDVKSLFCVRTITAFITLEASDFDNDTATTTNNNDNLEQKITMAAKVGLRVRSNIEDNGYTVQTVRLATNPFPDWLSQNESIMDKQLQRIDNCLKEHSIDFCSLGPASTLQQLQVCCPKIIESSSRFSCSFDLKATDTDMATAAAQCILTISKLESADYVQNGLGNFRFCIAANAKSNIPFFPVAKSGSRDSNSNNNIIRFGIGLENGHLASYLLAKSKSIRNIHTVFNDGYVKAIQPIQSICEQTTADIKNDNNAMSVVGVEYLGIDTSLNPSLDSNDGSVAAALETLDEINVFGGPGTLGAAAAITECLQQKQQHGAGSGRDGSNNNNIKLCGYCGLMLPLCEDTRLAQLANEGRISITNLLSISQVCGVGIDTVPIPSDCSASDLASLLLDVAGCAYRWDKSLSCRVFPVPGKYAGEMTTFDFPHLVNSRVLPLS